MTTLTVTAKGQVTLRKDILRHLGIRPGDRIALDKLPDGRIEVRAARPSGSLADVFGMLKAADRPALSIEEIGRIAASGWAGRQ
jgi:AbrB family looped-hinge helix DNA binding protein